MRALLFLCVLRDNSIIIQFLFGFYHTQTLWGIASVHRYLAMPLLQVNYFDDIIVFI